MLTKLKQHFLQHTTAYVVIGAMGGAITIGLACAAFVFDRRC
jgi:hypothetical protein